MDKNKINIPKQQKIKNKSKKKVNRNKHYKMGNMVNPNKVFLLLSKTFKLTIS